MILSLVFLSRAPNPLYLPHKRPINSFGLSREGRERARACIVLCAGGEREGVKATPRSAVVSVGMAPMATE